MADAICALYPSIASACDLIGDKKYVQPTLIEYIKSSFMKFVLSKISCQQKKKIIPTFPCVISPFFLFAKRNLHADEKVYESSQIIILPFFSPQCCNQFILHSEFRTKIESKCKADTRNSTFCKFGGSLSNFGFSFAK